MEGKTSGRRACTVRLCVAFVQLFGVRRTDRRPQMGSHSDFDSLPSDYVFDGQKKTPPKWYVETGCYRSATAEEIAKATN